MLMLMLVLVLVLVLAWGSSVLVPSSNFDAHSSFCKRNRVRCETCGEVTLRALSQPRSCALLPW
jgi:hypothetical protein